MQLRKKKKLNKQIIIGVTIRPAAVGYFSGNKRKRKTQPQSLGGGTNVAGRNCVTRSDENQP